MREGDSRVRGGLAEARLFKEIGREETIQTI